MTVTFHPLLQAGSLTLFVKGLSLSLCHDCLIGFYHLILSDVQDVGFIVLLPSITDEVSNEVTVVSCFLNYDMPYPPRGRLSLPGAWSFILSVFVLRETSTPKFLVQAQISFLSIKPTHSHVYLTHSPRELIISYFFFGQRPTFPCPISATQWVTQAECQALVLQIHGTSVKMFLLCYLEMQSHSCRYT